MTDRKVNHHKKILFSLLCLILFVVLFSYAQGQNINNNSLLTDDEIVANLEDQTDSDSDGLSDYQERAVYYTDPLNSDSDGDGYGDGEEIKYGHSPRFAGPKKLNQVDSDGDGLNDKWEIVIGADLMNPDSDSDGYQDGEEVLAGYDPTVANSGKVAKFIKVDISEQNLAYYFKNKLLESFPISGGVAGLPTPLGDFKVLDKVPTKVYGGSGYNFYYPNTKWNLHFTTGRYRFYIHGAYWHNNFGRPMSHGCVNVSYENMERLYAFAKVGTKILIHK